MPLVFSAYVNLDFLACGIFKESVIVFKEVNKMK